MSRLLQYIRETFDLDAYRDRDTLQTALTFALIAVLILALERFGLQDSFYTYFSELSIFDGFSNDQLAFYSQIHFSVSVLVLFVLIPTVFHFLLPVREPGIFGLGVRGLGPHLPVYAILPLIMIPIVWVVSGDPTFYKFYPMYNPESLRLWALYELVYFLQFFGVEFFFRGLLLFRLEKRFGALAVWIMTVPYAFIHIHKPFPEAVGSIIAGLVLGSLALRSRSIWAGVAVHIMIAFAADWFGLIGSGRWQILSW